MFLCSGAGAAQPPSEGVLRGTRENKAIGAVFRYGTCASGPREHACGSRQLRKLAMPADRSRQRNCSLERPSAKFPSARQAVGFSCCSACCLHLPSDTIRAAACSLTRVRMPRDADSPTSRHLLHCR